MQPATATALALPLLLLAACVSDGPQPRSADTKSLADFPVPDDYTIAHVGFSLDPTPEDTDQNGFYDTYTVTTFFFPRQDEYPLAVFPPGDILFTLTDRSRNTIATWRLSPDELAQYRIIQQIGGSYRFPLSLLDADTPPNTDNPDRPADRLAAGAAVLSMSYLPPDDTPPTDAKRSLTARIGPTGL